MIEEKTPVCLVSDPTKTGVVMSVSDWIDDVVESFVANAGLVKKVNGNLQ